MSRLTIIQPDARVTLGRFSAWLDQAEVAYRICLAAEEPLPKPEDCDGVIVLGGHMGVGDADSYPYLLPLQEFMRGMVANEQPLLGICLGGQLLAAALGGTVLSRQRGERGVTSIMKTAAGQDDPLLQDLPQPFLSYQWHNDSFDLPEDAELLAATTACPGQAFRVGPSAYGLQFHPEVNETLVQEWTDRAGAGPGYLAEFQRQQAPFEAASHTLLDNFLRLI
ncbi:MAG: GMP synthase [Desulfuromonas sp.]|nr:MAG: GMP synthase [Desulfuromonas sp.]